MSMAARVCKRSSGQVIVLKILYSTKINAGSSRAAPCNGLEELGRLQRAFRGA